jgi:ATP-binding cassette, subfamily B, bacterial
MTGRRVPLILQGSEVECAAACLAMVASHHGHQLTLRQARESCAIGRDGASASAVARAARGIGLAVAAYRPAPGIARTIPLPAIAHWGSDHFVVVERVTRTRVRIADPGRGRRSLPAAEFDASVGRVVLTAQPGDGFCRRRAATPTFWRRYAANLLRMPGIRLPLAQLLGASVIVQLLGLAVPAMLLIVIDKVIPSHVSPSHVSGVLPLIGGGILVLAAAQLITGYLRGALIIYLQGRLDTQAMTGFCAHLLRLPLDYFQRRKTGDIMLRASSLAMLRELLTTQVLTAVLDLMMIALYLAVMVAADLPVAAIVLVVIAIQLAMLVLTVPLARDRMSTELAAQAQAYGQLTEVIEGITTVKASAAEDQVLTEWTRLFLPWMRAALRRAQVSAAAEAVSGALRMLTPLAVLWLTARGVLGGYLPLGTAMALTWLASAIVVPLSVLTANIQRLQLAGAQVQRLADVLDTPPERHASGGRRPSARGQLELCRVGFRYDAASDMVLHDITLSVPPGARIAITGASGAGKTTLALLILGLYPPTSGAIRLDGVDLAALEPHFMRAQTGTVLQDPFIFSGTIASNIAFHDPAISADDIELAARMACLHSDIMAMPQGYQTRLAERGGGLSGGQRQRLAIARALVRQPGLLLLDEATSHLDAVTETAIYRNLSALDCTQILIAHRLSTVRDADLIVVLHDGTIAEHGAHEDLLDRGGRYAALVAAQLDAHTGNGAPVALAAATQAESGPGDIAERR